MSDNERRDDPPDISRLARELLGDFLEDANNGQIKAYADAAKRMVRSEKAAPVRQLVKELDEVNGGIFSRAVYLLISRKGGGSQR